MTVARSQLVDLEVTRFYHCLSRCVRQAHLCGEGREHRKQWIEDRLEVLGTSFAIEVCGFAVMDNHLHVVVYLEPEAVSGWSDMEVMRRWAQVFPPKNVRRQPVAVTEAWLSSQVRDKKLVRLTRKRLGDLGWFMKALKEPLSRLANREDGCRGAFWESRYKSIAILDTEALLATCAYIDLNPLAAGQASLPESSLHTSLRQRVEHVREQSGGWERLQAARGGSVLGSQVSGDLESGHWLYPIEQRVGGGPRHRRGMVAGFPLGSYLMLVDYSSRLMRPGKVHLSAKVAAILDRLDTTGPAWAQRLERLLSRDRHHGRYFATQRAQLRTAAAKSGLRRLVNLDGCAAE